MASKACADGKVKLNGENVKASKIIKIGENYSAKSEHKDWIIEVKELLYSRMNTANAINYYFDKSPEQEKRDKKDESFFIFSTGKRQSKIGRPTKKSRRNLDDFMVD